MDVLSDNVAISRTQFGSRVAPRQPATAGFTLVEIVTVVVILSIVAALALPSFSQQQEVALSAASRVVLADLLYAQSQAITTQQIQYVSFTCASNSPVRTSGSYSLSSPIASLLANPISQQPYTQLFGHAALSPFTNVELMDTQLGDPANNVLAFNELGQPLVCQINSAEAPLVGTGTITLGCGNLAVVLSIEPGTGNISVSAPQAE